MVNLVTTLSGLTLSGASFQNANSFSAKMVALQLVRNETEGYQLERIITTKNIKNIDDQNLIQRTYPQKHLDSRSSEELIFIFNTWTDLLEVQGYSDATAIHVGTLFDLLFTLLALPKLGGDKTRCTELPLNVRLDILNRCRNVLTTRNTPFPIAEGIFNALLYLMNHPEFPEKEQLSILEKILKYQEYFPEKNVLCKCIVLEHAKPEVQREAAALFFKDPLKNVAHLPFPMRYPNVVKEIRIESVHHLCKILQDKKTFHTNGLEQLSSWLWSLDSATLNDYRFALDVLKRLMVSEDPDFASVRLQTTLFSPVWTADPKHPMVSELLPFIKQTLSSKDTPLKIKIGLAIQMPEVSFYLTPNENSIPLIKFMIEQLETPDCPDEVKKIYIEQLLTFFATPSTTKLIQRAAPLLKSADSVSELKTVKDNPALLSAISKGKISLVDLIRRLEIKSLR